MGHGTTPLRHGSRAMCRDCNGARGCIENGPARVALERVRDTRMTAAGDVLFAQHTKALGVHSLRSGLVALRRTNAMGFSVLSRLVHAGDMLGLHEALAGGHHHHSALVLMPSEVCFIPIDGFRATMARHVDAWAAVSIGLASQMDALEESLVDRLRLPVRARVAQMLLSLRDAFGQVDDDGVLVIELPLSRSQIAELLAVRAETVTRAIGVLTSEGVARFRGRRVEVADLDALMDEVELPAEQRIRRPG